MTSGPKKDFVNGNGHDDLQRHLGRKPSKKSNSNGCQFYFSALIPSLIEDLCCSRPVCLSFKQSAKIEKSIVFVVGTLAYLAEFLGLT